MDVGGCCGRWMSSFSWGVWMGDGVASFADGALAIAEIDQEDDRVIPSDTVVYRIDGAHNINKSRILGSTVCALRRSPKGLKYVIRSLRLFIIWYGSTSCPFCCKPSTVDIDQ